MRCPFCTHLNTAVRDSRTTDDNAMVRRRRLCPECGARFSTIEHVQLLPLRVRKKNGAVELFKRDKLHQSLKIALHKRPVEDLKIEKIANSIMRQLESSGELEIPTQRIGELVMETLQDLDTVAYVRFASVYRNFHAVDDFSALLDTLSDTKTTPDPSTPDPVKLDPVKLDA